MDKQKLESFEQKAPEILADLAKHIEIQLSQKAEIDNEKAKQIGVEVAQVISQRWGGEIIYIPRNLFVLLNERDLKIFNEFNGTNHRELAKKYQVSMQWVYQIVKRVTKEEIARRQFDMFSET